MVAWAACISWFSTNAFSAHSTHHYIDPVLRFLFGDLTPQGFRLAHSVIRKTAHFTEYAILAILLCRAMTPPRGRVATAVLVRTIVLCATYAALDEVHQTFEANRTGSPVDVLIDAVGALSGALTLTWWRSGRPDERRPRIRVPAT